LGDVWFRSGVDKPSNGSGLDLWFGVDDDLPELDASLRNIAEGLNGSAADDGLDVLMLADSLWLHINAGSHVRARGSLEQGADVLKVVAPGVILKLRTGTGGQLVARRSLGQVGSLLWPVVPGVWFHLAAEVLNRSSPDSRLG